MIFLNSVIVPSSLNKEYHKRKGGLLGSLMLIGCDLNGYSKIMFGSAVSVKTLVWWGFSFSRAQKPEFGVSI